MRASWRLLAALGMTALFAAASAQPARITERTKQKRAAEAERAGLRQKLDALKRDISRTEAAKSRAEEELAQSEKAISEANRALHDLAEEQQQTEARLKRLTEEHDRLAAAVAVQQQKLSKMLREQYVTGNEDRIKLLLSGDNPNRINRDMQYMGYVSQAQARLIESLRADLQAIGDNKEEARNAKDELDEIAREQLEQKAQLEKEKTRRSTLLAQLSNKLSAQRKQAGNIERNEQRLAGLVERLAKLIEEQRKADLERERQRREQLARAKAKRDADRAARAARETLSKEKSKTAEANPDAIDNDEPPPKTSARNELEPVAGIQAGGFGQAFASLRGKLRLPVKGELIARYGGKRDNGPSWKGLFIRADEGTAVKAVAAGRVVFAEWLRGFGNIVIIDHGDQYMTVYGNNQSVLKRAGDVVNSGDVIATAGNSGGNEQSGLYFEMRHQGRTFDPLEWVNIR